MLCPDDHGVELKPHAFIARVDHRIHNNVDCDDFFVNCASLSGRLRLPLEKIELR
jgi:hypothetical protein